MEPKHRSWYGALRAAAAALALSLGPGALAQVYVDDDAPADTHPNDSTQSGFEDGSAAYPFDTIAEALAAPGGLVILRAGRYSGPGNRGLALSGAIVGERGADEVVVDLEQEAAFGVVASSCELAGLTIANGIGEKAGAVLVPAGAELVVRRCVFERNFATGDGDHGGAITACGSLRLWNSAFLRNATAGNGGAVAVACGSSALAPHLLEHDTFRGNFAFRRGGAVHFAGPDEAPGSSRAFVASICAENAAVLGAPDLSEQLPGLLAVYDSILQVPWHGPGEGSFVASPGFVDALDWHLGAGSPARDAAVGSTICLVDPQDADDQTRDCGAPDVGADEYAPVTHVVGDPAPGGWVTARISGATPGALALMTLSGALLSVPAYLGPPFQKLYFLDDPLLLAPLPVGAQGTAAWPLGLPALVGVEVYFQGVTTLEMDPTYTQVEILP